ncbi:MAG: UDP-2,3-diacylglucosamine diphosphatase LpxI [Alphaproteobacteria bacterium]|nr:UDP-2,3-diacylglucosamine diphosphatase LpxI [Alphaproteobacteria bacterium]
MKNTKDNDKQIALFCGAKRLPFLVRDSLRAHGWDVFVIGLRNFCDPALKPDLVIRIGGGGTAAKECKKRGITKLCFAGAIGHLNLSDVRPDLWSIGILAKVIKNQRGYESMFAALIAGIESKGFKIFGAQDLCPDLVFKPGVQTKTKPGKADLADIKRAVEVSKLIGAADIGQSVVVDKQVLAVEAAEGTSGMLKRVEEVRKGRKQSGVFAKMIKPQQDLRIDLPAIGTDTLRDIAAAGLRGIVVDAGNCFVIDRDEVLAAANKANMFILAK